MLCDIPGLIEGASDGLGMGHQFLRHVQRNKLLLHIVDGSSENPVENFQIINKELEKVRRSEEKKLHSRSAPRLRILHH